MWMWSFLFFFAKCNCLHYQIAFFQMIMEKNSANSPKQFQYTYRLINTFLTTMSVLIYRQLFNLEPDGVSAMASDYLSSTDPCVTCKGGKYCGRPVVLEQVLGLLDDKVVIHSDSD